MKKIILKISTFVVLIFSTNFAKSQAFEMGKSYVSVGYGVSIFNWGRFFNQYEDNATFKVSSVGPTTLKYEYALSEKFGIGASLGYTNNSFSWNDDSTNYAYKYTQNKLTANARFNFHFADHDKVDPYFGLGFGYKHNRFKLDTKDPNFEEIKFGGLFPVSMEAVLGVRFFFHENIGAFTELGIGHGVASAGLVAKF